MKEGQRQDQKVRNLGGATGSPKMYPQKPGDKGRGTYRKQAKRLIKKRT